MKLTEAVRRANQAGPPENSVRLRVACTGAVVVAILACAAQQEISRVSAYAAVALVIAGMVFSYHTRVRPPMWVKGLIALAAVAVLLWFFRQVGGQPVPDITTVENPLTVLFVWIQVVHSFHVPARRDLLFSLGGSAALMAVAAAQAIDLHYGLYALAWFGVRTLGAGGDLGVSQQRRPGFDRRAGFDGCRYQRGGSRYFPGSARPASGGPAQLPGPGR